MFHLIVTSLCLIVTINGQSCSSTATVDRNAILEVHNKMRSRIAQGWYTVRGRYLPPAANMMRMYYDCGLEASAQRAADMCLYRHTNAIPTGTGENIMYMRKSGGMTLEGLEREAMRMWEIEFEQFGFPRNRFDRDLLHTGTLHAYQMTWASTIRVGCGATLCDRGRMGLLFCHYKEQVFNDRYTYIEGQACTKCPGQTNCDYSTGLCG